MGIDLNGVPLTNDATGLALGTSGTKVVAANYGVRVPKLPGMHGQATLGGPYKNYPFAINDVNLNIGAYWSTSTYMFTCPVAGIYYISYGGIVGSGAVAGYISLIVNGGVQYYGYRDTTNIWELFHLEVMFKLAAGDTVAWAMNKAPGAENASTFGAYTSQHNASTIWLIG
jgi:hypothetical protein